MSHGDPTPSLRNLNTNHQLLIFFLVYLVIRAMVNYLMSFTTLLSLHHLLQVKFTPTNYLVWKNQFDSILNCFDLHSLIDPTTQSSDKLIKDDKCGKISQNPKFVNWWMNDQLLCSWLLSLLIEEVTQLTIRLNSFAEIWEVLYVA